MHEETQILHQFESITKRICDKYFQEISEIVTRNGTRPAFDVLMNKLKMMEKELTSNAVELAEDHKIVTGRYSDTLASGLKQITISSIEQLIKNF